MTIAVRETASGVQFGVKVVPGASRTRIAGVYGDLLKVQVAAPPEAGKANAALCELLATALAVAPRAVQVVSGATNPRKIVAIAGLTASVATAKLASLITPPTSG